MGSDEGPTTSKPSGGKDMRLSDYLSLTGAITDERLYRAFSTIDRAGFLPEDRHQEAHRDWVIPTLQVQGKSLSTNSQPSLIAAMIELLGLTGSERVLEIGTGTGYCTAILSTLLDRGEVYSVDILESLISKANQNLARYEITNAHVRAGDGFQGWEEAAPFDAILATVAIGDIPDRLFEQLKVGGRFVCPLYIHSEETPVYLLERSSASEVTGSFRIDAVFISMTEHIGPEENRLQKPRRRIVFRKETENSPYRLNPMNVGKTKGHL